MKNIFIAIITLIVLVGCSRTQALVNYEQRLVPDDLTIEQVRKSIHRAVVSHTSWRIKSKADGVINAEVMVRDHTAEVEIRYNQEFYSVNYVNSTNLKYGVNKKKQTVIHKNYNRWINNLVNRIEVELNTVNI